MKFSKENRRLLLILIIAITTIVMIVLVAFFFAAAKEKKLVNDRKELCAQMARELAGLIENRDDPQIYILQDKSALIKQDLHDTLDSFFRLLFNEELQNKEGLEGGIYIRSIDDFIGYAFPTSPPPLPAYGPPPRSHGIIRDQALLSITEDRDIINLHKFDPAVFPLATYPVTFNNIPCCAVWIRVHIERELPLARLKRIVNFATILSLFGFLVMAMISFILRNGINNIRRELKDSLNSPGYRLKQRGGWFGFIPARINDMLSMLEKENQDRKELEKVLQHKEKMAIMGKMVAGVAHEVRTPLSVVKTRVQMWEKEIMEDPDLQEKISPDSLKLVLDEINRLSTLVKRLLVFSRPIDKNIKPDNIEKIIEEVLSLTKLEMDTKSIAIDQQLNEHSPQIEVDGNSLRQVLINVINNSIESIEGKGSISISTQYDQEKKNMTIRIIDTGKGIPDERINKIFDPFYTSKESGTGLGLTISQEIITAHNGELTFENNPQGGVTCKIILPYKYKISRDVT